jgi:hypothetical protein
VGHVLQGRLWIQKVLPTSMHPVRSRTQSEGVIGCRFVFKVGGANSPRQNPAYSPPSTHNPRLNSVRTRTPFLRGTIREQLAEKTALERDLQCSFRLSSEFAQPLGQHAEPANDIDT